MKKFFVVWSKLLLVVLLGCYFISLALYVSPWFTIGAVLCLYGFFKLVALVGKCSSALDRYKKYELTVSLHKQGSMFLLSAILCVLYFVKHIQEENIISTALGIAFLCMYALSRALRNSLDSWSYTSQPAMYSKIAGSFLFRRDSYIIHSFQV